MAFYFRYLPNLDYINRADGENQISNFAEVKNFFKRGKIRDDIFGNLAYFEKYNIIGDDRPDNVAQRVYKDSSLDWIVLLSNNILNVYEEWPLTQESFDKYLLDKYKTYDNVYAPHHYETIEVEDSLGNIVLKSGLSVPSNFRINYFDKGLNQQKNLSNITVPVTNYEYESKIQDDKRNIFLLKADYVMVILNDLENAMPYEEGGEQYVNPTLKRVDDIRLYEG